MTVDGRPITFALDADSPDPIQRALAEGVFPGDVVNELWRHLTQPNHTVLDVGAHVGTYSLPAAATGARVLAVEPATTNADLLRRSAKLNGFQEMEVIQAVAAARAGTTRFAAFGPWGHVAPAGASGDQNAGVEVPAVALDDVIRAKDYGRISLVKIDVEGFELDALAGLRGLLIGDDAPPLLVESNGHMLHQYGHTPADLLVALEDQGYTCHRVESGVDRLLTPMRSSEIQPECVADYLAFKALPERIAPWQIGQPLSRAQVIDRVSLTCRDDQAAHREYGLRLLGSAPDWLLTNPAIAELLPAARRDAS